MKPFLLRYWFLLGLGLAMAVGYFAASSLEATSSWVGLRRSIVMTVMFLMALPLPLAMIVQTIRRPWAALLASVINFVLLPIFAWVISHYVSPVYLAGFLVVAATPCTLASAAVWTRRARGNEVTALMTTVITNLSSFVMTPLIVWVLLSQSAEVQFGDMVLRLLILVLIPIFAAQLLARNRHIGEWTTSQKKKLGIAAQIGILAIVLLGTAQSTLRVADQETGSLWSLAGVVFACALLHLVVLVVGYWLAKWVRLPSRERVAVAIAGSQKTLMIGLLVCMMLQVSLVPMVTYHAIQLVLDTFVADWFARQMLEESEIECPGPVAAK